MLLLPTPSSSYAHLLRVLFEIREDLGYRFVAEGGAGVIFRDDCDRLEPLRHHHEVIVTHFKI